MFIDMINEKNIQLFKALSEDTRYRIIKALLEAERKYKANKSNDCKGELCACEIPELIGRTQSNTSMHLAKLQDWGLKGSPLFRVGNLHLVPKC